MKSNLAYKITNKKSDITQNEITRYRLVLVAEMKKQGATENELSLIHDATIRNSIRSNRKPEDVAWAILQ